MSSLLISRLEELAESSAEKVAICSTDSMLSYAQLYHQVTLLALRLRALDVTRFAILEDNTAAWIIADLAGQMIEATVVPIPLFFSNEQQQHLIRQSGVQTVISSDVELLSLIAPVDHEFTMMPSIFYYFTAISAPVNDVHKPAKITYTSGSTGHPKGVCLSGKVLDDTLQALSQAVEQPDGIVHLCTLPLATLLENIAGAYLPLLKGGMLILKTQQELGIGGSSGLDIGKWHETLAENKAESLILTPELLKALIFLVRFKHLNLSALRFVAVGGGKVSFELLSQAKELGVPVYEGYGLSECGSVVALNSPSACKVGTVGLPLQHINISFTDEGEIIVSGNAYSGYLGEPILEQEQVATGDLGYLDDEGFLVISGRKKNLIISSFGRNISPEWVEAKLCADSQIAQALLIGDGEPFNIALLTPTTENINTSAIDKYLLNINQSLPDYAQIKGWIRSREPFSVGNGLLTENRRIKRAAILSAYQSEISACYSGADQSTYIGENS